MDSTLRLINAGALVACTVAAFLTSHRLGQAFRHGDWLALPLYGMVLAGLVWLWFRLEKQVRQAKQPQGGDA